MDYIKEYRKFVNGYNFSYALRVTVATTLPAIVFSYFNLFHIGLVASMGAMTVSNADVPGPMHRRFNAMAATLILNFCIALLTGYSSTNPVLVTILIAVLCFALTIIGVYGSRVNTVGFAGLIIMVLTLDSERSGWEVLYNGLYLLCGSLWYMLLSLALFRIRPYRIIQQALGEYILSIAEYLKIRSAFYGHQVNYDLTYKSLMQQQHNIHEKQEMLREMIFKSRSIVRQSTITSRTLLVIFIDTIDLFEKVTGAVYNYQSMHRRFDASGILSRFQSFILDMVDELEEIGLAVQSGNASRASKSLSNSLQNLKADFEKFFDEELETNSIGPLISMQKIMQSMEDMTMRIYTLHHYTRYDKRHIKDYQLSGSIDDFVKPSNFNSQLLVENLSIHSNTFRHAVRVSIATTVGYLVALMLNLGHSYWVLLTILVILKPSYSLTKQRNYNRLIGTIIGAFLGVGVLWVTNSQSWQLAIMIGFMLLFFSFIRVRYFTGVIFMTAFLIIFFFMLNPRNIFDLLETRVMDTAIGSAIAFLATYMLAPTWEKDQLKDFMIEAVEKSQLYFKTVAQTFNKGFVQEHPYRVSRKEAFIAQANLSGGFTRMLNEPKSKQHKANLVHQFTVLINVLNSHIVTLADFAQKYAAKYTTAELLPVTNDVVAELMEAKNILARDKITAGEKIHTAALQEDIKELETKRRKEIQQGLTDTETKVTMMEYKPILDQFLFISRIAGDIKELAGKL
ncbi:MAG: FUSC family membrane protein [Niabella sp.]